MLNENKNETEITIAGVKGKFRDERKAHAEIIKDYREKMRVREAFLPLNFHCMSSKA